MLDAHFFDSGGSCKLERLMRWDKLCTRNYGQGLVNHTKVAHSSKRLMSFTYKRKGI